MLAIIEFDYYTKARLTELGRDFYATFCERFPEFQLEPWEEGKDEPPYIYFQKDPMIDLSLDGPFLTEHQIPFKIKRFKGAYYSDAEHRRSDRGKADLPSASYIQVAIPNLALLEIRTVQVLEDACTEKLQSELDNGWRILAVCPPNSQRRPDYILGKTSA